MQQELIGMEDTMMREISKKDAELAQAYIKLEEHQKCIEACGKVTGAM